MVALLIFKLNVGKFKSQETIDPHCEQYCISNIITTILDKLGGELLESFSPSVAICSDPESLKRLNKVEIFTSII